MTKFDSVTIILSKGQSIMEAVKEVMKKKGLASRTEDATFIIDEVTVQSIEGDKVSLEIEYEYGW